MNKFDKNNKFKIEMNRLLIDICKRVNLKEFNFVMCSAILSVACSSVVVELKADNITTAVELAEVMDSSVAGDTIMLESGEWKDQNLVISGKGSEGKPIVVMSRDQLIMTGNSSIKISGEYITVSGIHFRDGTTSNSAVVSFRDGSKHASNCRFTNGSIIDYNSNDSEDEYKWVSIYGVGNRVDHCVFSGKTNQGATMVVWIGDEPNYTRIDNNYFGKREDLGKNGGETIRIGTSTNSMKESRAVVESNLFEECDGEIEIISNKSCFNTYRYNTFRDCDGCLTLRHGNDCSVYGNFFFGGSKSSGGVRIIGERHKIYNNYFERLNGDDYRSAICFMNGVPDSPLNRYFQVKSAVVVFNTIVDCKSPVIFGAGEDKEKSLAPLDCVFANNIIDGVHDRAVIEIEDKPKNLEVSKNYLNSTRELECVGRGYIFTEIGMRAEGGIYRPKESYETDLIFDFIKEDIDGDLRSGSCDAGCDQIESNKIIHKPLTKNDFGIK